MPDPIDLEALAAWIESFNAWRRGQGTQDMPHPVEIGKRLDEAARAVRLAARMAEALKCSRDAIDRIVARVQNIDVCQISARRPSSFPAQVRLDGDTWFATETDLKAALNDITAIAAEAARG